MMPSVGWARARAGYRRHHAALASPPSPVSPQPPARLVVLGDSPGARGTKGQEGGRVRQQLPVEAKEERVRKEVLSSQTPERSFLVAPRAGQPRGTPTWGLHPAAVPTGTGHVFQSF